MNPKDLHTLLAFLGWGLTIDLNLILKRYSTTLLSNQLIHIILGLISTILSGSAVLVLAIDKIKFISQKNSFKSIHYCTGFSLTLISIIILWVGYKTIRSLSYKRNFSLNNWRLYMKRIGWMLYFGVKIEMLIGFTFHLGDLIYLYIFYLIILTGTIATLELNKRRKVNKLPTFTSNYRNQIKTEYESLVQDINSNASVFNLEEKFSKIKWVMVGNQIYDLTNFNHPGGTYIIDVLKGRELSRYMYGGQLLESENIFHNHSLESFLSIEKYCIGNYQRTENYFTVTSAESMKFGNELHQPFLLHQKFTYESDHQKVWHLVSRELEPSTVDIYRYDFTTEDIYIKFHPSSHFSFGRYVLLVIKDETNPILRPYTICSSLSGDNKIIRHILLENFENLVQRRDISKPIDKELLSRKTIFSLYIKHYQNRREMTYRLHNCITKRTKFSIIGPIGRGFELDPQFSGKIFILFIGTGIIPFLDFLNFLLAKTIYTYVQQNYDEDSARNFELPLNYDQYRKIDITIVGSFGENPIGLEILQSLTSISQYTKSSTFDCYLKSENNESNLNINYFKGKIDDHFLHKFNLIEYSKFFICGTSNFNVSMQRYLHKLNISTERIVLL